MNGKKKKKRDPESESKMMTLLEEFFRILGREAVNGEFVHDGGESWEWDRISVYVTNKLLAEHTKAMKKQIAKNRRKSSWNPAKQVNMLANDDDESEEGKGGKKKMMKNKDDIINAHLRGFGCDRISRWRMSLKELGINGAELTMPSPLRKVDLFVLRMVSLVVCRGEVEDKAKYFTKLISPSQRE